MFGFSFPEIIILAVIIVVVLILKRNVSGKNTDSNDIINTTGQFYRDDVIFEYNGGIVTRVKLEKAIDVFVKIEEEYQKKQKLSIKAGQPEPDYKGIVAKYSNETDAAERAIRQFGKQIKPNKLKNMQKEFYDIINNKNGIKKDIAYSLLNSNWDGIGEWRR